MDLVVALHSHLPFVLNHGRWPHGSDWLCEAVVDTYLPLLEQLDALDVQQVPSPVTLGITPILANQLAHPGLVREVRARGMVRVSHGPYNLLLYPNKKHFVHANPIGVYAPFS